MYLKILFFLFGSTYIGLWPILCLIILTYMVLGRC